MGVFCCARMIGNRADDIADPKEERRKLREQQREDRRRHREEKEKNLAKGLTTPKIIGIVSWARIYFSLVSCNCYGNVMTDFIVSPLHVVLVFLDIVYCFYVMFYSCFGFFPSNI